MKICVYSSVRCGSFHGKTSYTRVTTCLENLEISGHLTAVREVSGEKILSGESGLKLFIVSCIYLHSFLTLLSLCISFWFWIMHCCIPTPATDNNTSTGMIWVTLNMGRSVANCHGIVRESHVVWRVVTLLHLSTDEVKCDNCSGMPSHTWAVLASERLYIFSLHGDIYIKCKKTAVYTQVNGEWHI